MESPFLTKLQDLQDISTGLPLWFLTGAQKKNQKGQKKVQTFWSKNYQKVQKGQKIKKNNS